MTSETRAKPLTALFFGLITVASCAPQVEPIDPFWISLLTAPRGHCAIASLSNAVSGSGVLSCMAADQYSCGQQLVFSDLASRNRFVNQISPIGVEHSDCLIAAANALTAVNALSLPASYLARRAGGTLGPHNSANYVALHIEDCAGLGIASTSFLGTSASVGDAPEMIAFAQPAGFVAAFDATGACGSAQNLDTKIRAATSALASGSKTVGFRCDFGADDPALSDCPPQAERSQFHIGGIDVW